MKQPTHWRSFFSWFFDTERRDVSWLVYLRRVGSLLCEIAGVDVERAQTPGGQFLEDGFAASRALAVKKPSKAIGFQRQLQYP